MRVLEISWEYPPVIEGGLGRHVRKSPYPRDIEAFVRWVDAMKADMYRMGMELCERFDVDLVHSHDWLVAGAAERVARQIARPWLTTIHATEFGRHQGWVRLLAAARARVLRFDWATVARRTRELYAELAGRRRPEAPTRARVGAHRARPWRSRFLFVDRDLTQMGSTGREERRFRCQLAPRAAARCFSGWSSSSSGSSSSRSCSA